MHNTYTGTRLRIRPHANLDEAIKLSMMHLSPLPGWGPDWYPLGELSGDWEDDGLFNNTSMDFTVEEVATSKPIGYLSLSPPPLTKLDSYVSTYILPEYQRQGYGIEAKQLALCCLFENYHVHRVSAITLSNHVAARRGLECCGFTLEGSEPGTFFSDGQREDKVHYRIFREEWERMEYRQQVKRGVLCM